jgi:hypothetical protein
MNRNAILSILGGAGIFIYGSLTPDAIALARAIQSNNPVELVKFADQNRHSPLAGKALMLARNDLRCWPEKVKPWEACSSGNGKGYQS